jgi:hypothetical protein
MKTKSLSALKRPAILLILWAIILYVSIIFSIFLHEDGHGIGAKLDGIHVSTGFNKVGDYGKSPDDPDFRTGETENSVWGGLLGPISSWLLAIIFTVWLYCFKGSSWGALIVGALAVGNSLIRTVPMALALISALMGRPYMEDEIGWGIWYVLKFYHPELAGSALGFHALLKSYACLPGSPFLILAACWLFLWRALSWLTGAVSNYGDWC